MVMSKYFKIPKIVYRNKAAAQRCVNNRLRQPFQLIVYTVWAGQICIRHFSIFVFTKQE